MKKITKWFTLVELIVVVSILAILSAIWFVSYAGYISWVRDTNRISNLKSISDGLTLISSQARLPMPQDAVEVLINGSTVWYQGYIWESILKNIDFAGQGVDPETKQYYTYYINNNRKNFQVMGFLENEENTLWQSVSANYDTLYPVVYGNSLGILTDDYNTPIQEIAQYQNAWQVDLTWAAANDTLRIYVENDLVFEANGSQLEELSSTFSNPNQYKAPKSCPDDFIPVWWNAYFNQEPFCISKYEVGLRDETWATFTTTSGWDFGTYSYQANTRYISKKWSVPVAEIKYLEAKSACESMWPGFHLTTHNQWMSVARSIELNKDNWSNGEIGDGYIYAWNASNTADPKWCYEQWDSGNTFGAKWWIGNASCNEKRKHTLLMGEEIWDFAWNLWEIVEKPSTDTTTLWTGNIEWSAVTDQNLKKQFWPLIATDSNQWIWRIYNAAWVSSPILVRWWSAWDAEYSGIYALDPSLDGDYFEANTWFRCSYTK